MAMACDHQNNIIVTGMSQEAYYGEYDIATIKYGPNGETLWVQRYGYPNRYDSAATVSIDQQDNIYIVGISFDSANRPGITSIKYLPNGDTAWVRRYDDSLGECYGKAGIVDSSGNLYVLGFHRRLPDSLHVDYTFLKYAPNGDLIWSKYVNAPSNPLERDFLMALCRDPFGNFIAIGPIEDTTGGFGDNFLTIKFDDHGDTLWARQFGGQAGEDDYPVSVTTDDSGNVYVCGASDGASYYDYSIVKYTRDGEFRFEARYNNSEANDWDVPSAVTVDAQHNIYATGYSTSTEANEDYCTVKFKANYTGEDDTVWVQPYHYPGSMENVPTAMALDQYANALVTGYCDSPDSGYAMVTIKYDLNGGRQWVARYDPTDYDEYSNALARDGLGNIYIAGGAEQITTQRDYATLKYSAPDVGVTQVIAPPDTVRSMGRFTPSIVVRNYSAVPASFPVWMTLISPNLSYANQQNITNLAPFDSQLVTFTSWTPVDSGTFQLKTYTQLTGDQEPRNDTIKGTVVAIYPWIVKAYVPEGLKKKKVKDGGSLASDDGGHIYCMKGSNTLEYYMFNCSTQAWTSRESVPVGGARKKVKKGGALAYGGNNLIYACKGGRTAEFWAYDVIARTWGPRTSLPAPLKGGTGITRAAGSIYVLQGSNSQSFWSYKTATDSPWTSKSPMPLGIKNKRPKDGSCIAFDGSHTIYALKGKTNEFYSYDMDADAWTPKKDIPLIYPTTRKKKKMGDGGSMAFTGGRVYCFKGGNTNEFWAYNPATDTWAAPGPVNAPDSMLAGFSGKRVKTGGSLTVSLNKIYALKGNNTLEFYMYNANITDLFAHTSDAGVQGKPLGLIPFSLKVSPNPFRNTAMVTYSLPRPGLLSLKLYDIAGRLQENFYTGQQSAGIYRLKLSDSNKASGIYFLKLLYDDGSKEDQLTSKVLIPR
jgi:hypothetical protein